MSTEETRKRGRVVVVSGPSGVGKSTICHRLCEMVPGEFSVSVTTRRSRPGERGARDYHYVSPEEFEELRDRDGLIEWAEVYGHLYGTPLAPIREALATGRVMVREIDIQGCIQVRKKAPEALTFFLLPPTPEEQRRRIEGRQTDAVETIRERLSKADGEIRFGAEAGCYDHFIVNDDLEGTIDQIYQLIMEGRTEVPSEI